MIEASESALIISGDDVRTAIDLYLQHRYAEGAARLTVQSHRYVLEHFARQLGWLLIAAVTTEHVRTWLRDARIAASTRRTRLATLRTFFRWAVAEGHVEADPTERLRPPKAVRRLPRALPADAVGALLEVAPDARARLIILLMVQLGLRRGECARLEVGDVDFRSRTLRIIGKGGHERMLPIVAEVWHALDVYLAEHPATSGPLLRGYKTHAAMRPEWFSREVGRLMREAGIKRQAYDGVSAHALRHTAATDVLGRIRDPRVVQQMLGHASLSSTHVYTALSYDLERLRDAMEERRY